MADIDDVHDIAHFVLLILLLNFGKVHVVITGCMYDIPLGTHHGDWYKQ